MIEVNPKATAQVNMRSIGVPCMSPFLVDRLLTLQKVITAGDVYDGLILRNTTPGVFSLGGDLSFFLECVETGAKSALEAYVAKTIQLLYRNSTMEIPTIALVQGDAFGGGFEAALSCDIVVAEKRAVFSFPEKMFGLFPAMGAYSFISRRAGLEKAVEMIYGGGMYTAEEMHRARIVDVLVENGTAGRVANDLIKNREVFKRPGGPSMKELTAISNTWITLAMKLSARDKRTMKALVSRQQAKWPSEKGESK